MNFQKYEGYDSEDFATDMHFTKWVHSPNDQYTSVFWETFLRKYPDKAYDIEMARNKILNLENTHSESLSDEEIEILWQRINQTIITAN
jgi:transmembrane sensor